MNLINQAVVEVKKSKFFSYYYELESPEEVKEIIKKIKEDHKKAKHVVYAYKFSNTGGKSDDKEPNGTAGTPLYNLLERNNLNNKLIVVVRYFGGTKLGVGPLLRAYTEAGKMVINQSKKTILKSIIILMSIFMLCGCDNDSVLKHLNTDNYFDYDVIVEHEITLESIQNDEDVQAYVEELNTYLDNLGSLSIVYEDISTGYNFSYNLDNVYYAASTIKLPTALYIYEEADKGNIDLDSTLTYTTHYASSKGIDNHTRGDNISLRTLVSYAILYSDNTAYRMLYNYLGKNTIQQFGRNLGATSILIGTDAFGYINANDALYYLKELNKYFETNTGNAIELKDYFLNATHNHTVNNNYANKYGYYGNLFHSYGIVYNDYPYYLVILTEHGRNYEQVIHDVSEKIDGLYKVIYEKED